MTRQQQQHQQQRPPSFRSGVSSFAVWLLVLFIINTWFIISVEARLPVSDILHLNDECFLDDNENNLATVNIRIDRSALIRALLQEQQQLQILQQEQGHNETLAVPVVSIPDVKFQFESPINGTIILEGSFSNESINNTENVLHQPEEVVQQEALLSSLSGGVLDISTCLPRNDIVCNFFNVFVQREDAYIRYYDVTTDTTQQSYYSELIDIQIVIDGIVYNDDTITFQGPTELVTDPTFVVDNTMHRFYGYERYNIGTACTRDDLCPTRSLVDIQIRPTMSATLSSSLWAIQNTDNPNLVIRPSWPNIDVMLLEDVAYRYYQCIFEGGRGGPSSSSFGNRKNYFVVENPVTFGIQHGHSGGGGYFIIYNGEDLSDELVPCEAADPNVQQLCLPGQQVVVLESREGSSNNDGGGGSNGDDPTATIPTLPGQQPFPHNCYLDDEAQFEIFLDRKIYFPPSSSSSSLSSPSPGDNVFDFNTVPDLAYHLKSAEDGDGYEGRIAVNVLRTVSGSLDDAGDGTTMTTTPTLATTYNYTGEGRDEGQQIVSYSYYGSHCIPTHYGPSKLCNLILSLMIPSDNEAVIYDTDTGLIGQYQEDVDYLFAIDGVVFRNGVQQFVGPSLVSESSDVIVSPSLINEEDDEEIVTSVDINLTRCYSDMACPRKNDSDEDDDEESSLFFELWIRAGKTTTTTTDKWRIVGIVGGDDDHMTNTDSYQEIVEAEEEEGSGWGNNTLIDGVEYSYTTCLSRTSIIASPNEANEGDGNNSSSSSNSHNEEAAAIQNYYLILDADEIGVATDDDDSSSSNGNYGTFRVMINGMDRGQGSTCDSDGGYYRNLFQCTDSQIVVVLYSATDDDGNGNDAGNDNDEMDGPPSSPLRPRTIRRTDTDGPSRGSIILMCTAVALLATFLLCFLWNNAKSQTHRLNNGDSRDGGGPHPLDGSRNGRSVAPIELQYGVAIPAPSGTPISPPPPPSSPSSTGGSRSRNGSNRRRRHNHDHRNSHRLHTSTSNRRINNRRSSSSRNNTDNSSSNNNNDTTNTTDPATTTTDTTPITNFFLNYYTNGGRIIESVQSSDLQSIGSGSC